MSVLKSLATPGGIKVRPRRMDMQFDHQVPRYWFDNDPVVTHFLNALSITFPEGERFFVDAVRAFRDQVQDPERQKEISGFIGQEAMHSKEHLTFNAFLAKQGYADVCEHAEKITKRLLNGGRKRFANRRLLAATAGLEHITAVLAKCLLENPQQMEAIHDSVRPLWMWHAIEETEHKAVAFDLYKDVGGNNPEKNLVMLLASFYLVAYSLYFTRKFLAHDGISFLRNPLVVSRGIWKLVGPGGFITPALREYFHYFANDFHPWQDDNHALIAPWLKKLAESYPIPQAA